MKINKQIIIIPITGTIILIAAFGIGLMFTKATTMVVQESPSETIFEVGNTATDMRSKNGKQGGVTSGSDRMLSKLNPQQQARVSKTTEQYSERSIVDSFATNWTTNTNQGEGSLDQRSDDQILEQVHNELDYLDRTIQSEPIDPSWTDSAVTMVQDSWLHDPELGFTVQNVECRSSLCRFEMGFEGSVSQDSFNDFAERLPWIGEVFFHLDDTQSGNAVVYLAREGHAMPVLSN